MAYSNGLAERIRTELEERQVQFEEKKMMGGLTFMVDEKMCVGVVGEDLMARIDPDIYEEALTKEGCKEMEFTGRPMKGFVFVEPEGTGRDQQLEYWISLCLQYNPKAKSSKKKNTKRSP
ncbi:MAG: TfoX/Sxy family protein [Ignavibacteriae bacterium]|nr:TfoX/Sxy family protein [Ignavibacteriota bacterium]MCB9215007.1 TfoX/Sxy family protein [Ignavibacteria bacterium]